MSVSNSIPIVLVNQRQLNEQFAEHQTWISISQFKADPGTFCLIPDSAGSIKQVLVGRGDALDTWTLGSLAQSLPSGNYHLADTLDADEATKLCLGWQLGQYQFLKYKENGSGSGSTPSQAQLAFPATADQEYIEAATAATYLVRDLINTPANDMGPAQLADAASAIAKVHDAEFQVITGEDLINQRYPMIYAVGQANAQSPRLIDIHWGSIDAPKITLVGKGVCFDTGGLDIKPAAGMKLMKKDMGGAAQVLGLAKLIMQMKLPVRLRVLIPAVENSIAENAMRPSDVLQTRKGITVEVGNTDAEGRLVLADALWEASSESPQLLIDCATLTGAARVALGTELPAFFCNDPAVADQFQQAGLEIDDPLWHMPLHEPYREMLSSKIADLSNIGNAPYGGAITAALFLREFVQKPTTWIHIDFMAWNLRSLPGRPEGGEAMGMRALFELIRRQVG